MRVQQILVVVVGAIAEDLRRDLVALDPMLRLEDVPEYGPDALLERRPHLVVLGERSGVRAGEIVRSSLPDEEPVPVLAAGDDPDADVRLVGGLARAEALRLAYRLARLHRSGDRVREAFQERLAYEFARAFRYRHSVSLVTLSVDRRDRLTSVHGDAAVEEFLTTLEDTLRRGLRDVDLLFRSAEEELSAILPETPAQGATLVADRFLAQTSRLVWKPASSGVRPSLPVKTTSSIGVADGPRKGVSTSEDLLRTARESMGSARSAGGGRVAIHGIERIEENRIS